MGEGGAGASTGAGAGSAAIEVLPTVVVVGAGADGVGGAASMSGSSTAVTKSCANRSNQPHLKQSGLWGSERTFGNPPCFDPSKVSPTSQSSSSAEGPVTRILMSRSISYLLLGEIDLTHVSSFAKDRSVAWGDLYFRLAKDRIWQAIGPTSTLHIDREDWSSQLSRPTLTSSERGTGKTSCSAVPFDTAQSGCRVSGLQLR